MTTNKSILIENYDNNYDSFLNRIVAYNEIISTIDYKWYKSSKRRLLMPSFYLTRFFFNFLKKNFFKNSFRKNVQTNKNVFLLNTNPIYSKKMFMMHFDFSFLLNNSNCKSFFFFKKSRSFLKNDRFFFDSKTLGTFNQSFIYLNNSVVVDDNLKNIVFYKKIYLDHTSKTNFDFFIFFYIFNNSVLEVYKIFIALFFLIK